MTLNLKTEPEKVQHVISVVKAEFNALDKWVKLNSSLGITSNPKSGEILVRVAPLVFKILKLKLREWLQ